MLKSLERGEIKQKTFLIHVKDSLKTMKRDSQVLLFLRCKHNKALEIRGVNARQDIS